MDILDIQIKEEAEKLYKQAFTQAENINYLDQTSKIIIQSALRSAIKMNEHFFNHKKIVSNYLKASDEKLSQIEKTLN